MHRVGAATADALELAGGHRRCRRRSGWPACCTHLAVADEPARSVHRDRRSTLFDDVLTTLGLRGHRPPIGPRRQLGRRLSRFPAVAASTWCAPASPSTASRQGPHVDQLAAALRPALSLRARVLAREAGAAPATASRTACGTASRPTTTVATLPARLRRRGASAAVRRRRRGADRRPATADRRRRHDGPADGRLRRRRHRRSATRRC